MRWPDGRDDIVPGSKIEKRVSEPSSAPPKDDEGIPTSRLSRSARVGRLAAGQGARQLATRAANVTRSEEGKRKALEKRQVETAEQIVAALGTMKGAAMKLGQVMSFLDVGLVPEEYREEFQTKLAALRDAAPKVDFKDMKKVLEKEYGEKLDEVFETFDPVPIAAASIGQVYKASLPGGRCVAVKVQYPGVAQAVRSDMQNLSLILRLMKSIAPGLDPKAIGDEIRLRIDEELDYELEASNQRALARIYRDHPFIVVPEVITSLSHEQVIVSEFVDGRGFEELKQLPQEERNRLGEIIFRFYFGCMYRHHQFSGDPHPGNSLLLRDGRMAFLDFGLFKRLPAAAAERELAMARFGIEGRAQRPGRRPARVRLRAGVRALLRRAAAGAVPRPDLVVHDRRGDRAHAGDRHPGDDRHERPALAPLRPDAPRVAAARPPLRPPPGGADARGAGPAARPRQLVPDRPRVDLRRRRPRPSWAARRPSSTRR